jgi:hypothetical protein
VISQFWEAIRDDNESLGMNTLKWLRGEYTTKRESKKDLGVDGIIADKNWYEHVKLLTFFAVKAGYKGVLMLIDELSYISNNPNTTARRQNYDKLLSIFNDTTQSKVKHLGVIVGATTDCITDERCGVFSSEALKSRLGRSLLSDADAMHSQIINLVPLEQQDICSLLEKLQQINKLVSGYTIDLSPEDIQFFIKDVYTRIGARFITPREVIKDFFVVLDRINATPNETIRDIINDKDFEYSTSDKIYDTIEDAYKEFNLE